MLIKSKYVGMAPAAHLASIKISSGSPGTTFTERALVQAINATVADVVPTGTQKLINWSGTFGSQTANAAYCAMQIAANRNVGVFASAGNDNLEAPNIGYNFLVGAYQANVSAPKPSYSRSSFGFSIDIWAPSAVPGQFWEGSSMATPWITGIAAAALTQHSGLRNNHQRLYKFISDLARTDVLNPNDPKIAGSWANTKSANIWGLSSQPVPTTNYYSSATNFCGLLPTPVNVATPNWASLINQASTTTLGEWVDDSSNPPIPPFPRG
jgi:hypothetical protein